MTAPLHFARPYNVTTLCDARRQRNVRDTTRIDSVTCKKCLALMIDPKTGTPYVDFDTPGRIAGGLEGVLARYELDPILRDLLAEYAKRLRAMR